MNVDVSAKKTPESSERNKKMSLWVLIIVVVAWFLLQAYILPKLGIST